MEKLLFPNRCNPSNLEFVLCIDAADEAKPLKAASIFLWEKAIEGICGQPKNVRRLKNGNFILTLTSEKHRDILLNTKTILNIPVNCYLHQTANTSKGILRCRDLWDQTNEDIIEGLAGQGVIGVKRFTMKRNGEVKATNTLLLTFNSARVPCKIKVFFQQYDIQEYIPNPLRCYNCQKYGHGSSNCRGTATCFNCGSQDHTSDCNMPSCCINCKGSHAASSKQCQKWLEEKEIVAIKVREGISFPEARQRFNTTRRAAAAMNFAAAVSQPAPSPKRSSPAGRQLPAMPSKPSPLLMAPNAGAKKVASRDATPVVPQSTTLAPAGATAVATPHATAETSVPGSTPERPTGCKPNLSRPKTGPSTPASQMGPTQSGGSLKRPVSSSPETSPGGTKRQEKGFSKKANKNRITLQLSDFLAK